MAYTTINKSTDYFNTKLYTGTGSAQSITGLDFQPDFTWIKPRSIVDNHVAFDAVRGATKVLKVNLANAESTVAQTLTSFNSDGFSIGNDGEVSGNNATYASWNWLASNTTTSNTDGSITSTVSANTTSGFSIVSYTGTGANATIGHGLSVAPAMIIIKGRTLVDDWIVYHQSTGNTDALFLNLTNSKNAAVSYWNNTSPTSSVFSVGTNDRLNRSGDNYIAYCFAEKTGYSKIGSYTGAGSNLPFIYTGFKPAFLILKRTDATGYNWVLSDAVRDVDNPVLKYVHPNTNDAEQSGSRDIDFLSNGFKFRNSNTTWNASGGSYIYMAFAEAPLVGTNNIPCTAR